MNYLEIAEDLIRKARCPEDIFGTDQPDKERRTLLARVHPDVWEKEGPDAKQRAEDAFKKISEWALRMEEKLGKGTYGDRKLQVLATLTTKGASYSLTEEWHSDHVARQYRATNAGGTPCLVKVVRQVADNDLMQNEGRILRKLHEGKQKGSVNLQAVPDILDTFRIDSPKGKKVVNVYADRPEDFHPMSRVITDYPQGVPLEQAAWMFNRCLEALYAGHLEGIVHGNLNPGSMMLEAPNHYGMLTQWYYATAEGEQVKGYAPKWKYFLLDVVFNKKPFLMRNDIEAAAQAMFFVLGFTTRQARLCTDPHIEATIGRGIKGLLRSCLLGHQHDVMEVRDKHRGLLKEIFGPPAFREFKWADNQPATV